MGDNFYAKPIVKPESRKTKVLQLPPKKWFNQTPRKAPDEQQLGSPTEEEDLKIVGHFPARNKSIWKLFTPPGLQSQKSSQR